MLKKVPLLVLLLTVLVFTNTLYVTNADCETEGSPSAVVYVPELPEGVPSDDALCTQTLPEALDLLPIGGGSY